MSETPAPYGNPKRRPKPEPEIERPDIKVLRELLEKSKSPGTASPESSEKKARLPRPTAGETLRDLGRVTPTRRDTSPSSDSG